jgi:hypothetical protein
VNGYQHVEGIYHLHLQGETTWHHIPEDHCHYVNVTLTAW